MSALLQTSFPGKNYPSRRHSSSVSRRQNPRQKSSSSQQEVKNINQARSQQKKATSVARLQQKQALPLQLQILLLFQRSSFGMAFLLIATSIFVYVSNVRIPQLWSDKYQKLETLQRQERELTAINESLKHEISEQAREQDNNLAALTASNAVFIPPASLLSASDQNQSEDQPSKLQIYSGY